MTLKFYYNGVKDEKGATLQKAHYSKSGHSRLDPHTITIYAKEYSDFSNKIHKFFYVENNSEYETDYVVRDHIRVEPAHPLYNEVNIAYEKQQAKRGI